MARRRHNLSDSRRFLDWINAAYDDCQAAELLRQDSDLNNMTAFHCQQCAEKSLKGYILAKSGQALDGHNLPWLCKRAAKIDGSFFQWLDEAADLNRCYIETRYPTDIPTEISDPETARLVEMTRKLFFYIAEDLDVVAQLDDQVAY